MADKNIKELSKIITENFWAVWFLVLVSLILIFNAKQNDLARVAWQKYRNANLAILFDRSDADLAMLIGNYYFNGVIGGGGYNLDIAERAFKKAVSIDPKIFWGHYQLARVIFVKGGYYNSALEEINKELKANPENLRSLYVRGLIYGYRKETGDLARAESDFRNFTLWAPKEWAGYNDLAWVLSKQEKYEAAENTINLAFKEALNAKNNPWLWNALGVAELNLRKYAEAGMSFEKAGELAKNLTVRDWGAAYPGNSPASAASGLSAFKAAIDENLRRANLGN